MTAKKRLRNASVGGSLKIWNAWKNEIFIYTEDYEFYKVLQKITGFRHFSTYEKPLCWVFAWQAIFAKKRRERIEKVFDLLKDNELQNGKSV